ncbi:MAG: excinuclease ABC subunit C [Flavobacteriales bacterium]|nr:excinuclease ABC subunit C [Flavobacteriales bacterium]
MSTTEHDLKVQISLLPDAPGVYQYFDKTGKIIYVGKAKNLKKRVSSYFNKNQENNKTRILVSHIHQLKFIVVESELDALLLENNLIKTYQPKYNIALKDDKTYPWIVIKKEPFPRIFQTRQKRNDGSKYFGPYPNVKVMQSLLGLIKEMYPLRTCSLDLQQYKIEERKYKTCLEFHIGRCLGPCIGNQTKVSYDKMVDEIELFLKGKTYYLIQLLKSKMLDFSDKYQFEKAHEMKTLIEQIEKYRSKSSVVSSTISDVDVFTIEESENRFFFNFLMIQEGAIIHAYTSEVTKKLDEDVESIVSYVLPEIRQRFESNSKEVILQSPLSISLPNVNFTVPQIGEKKKLIELSLRNVNYYRLDKLKKEHLNLTERDPNRVLKQVQTDFKLNELPVHMECFDNSNFQGTNAVSACVVFKNGKPAKNDYRHFNVKTVEGPDDFATMREVVYRRYKRMLDENQPLPQLIIIDGGKGQLGAAMEAITELSLRGKVVVVGIAKRLEEIFYPGDQYPIYIDKRSESLKLIQFMRNEAHRFGITHHRNKRSKNSIQSELLNIKGIGEKTMQELFKEFKTIKAMKETTLEELEKKIGRSKATILFNFFKEN